MCNLKMRMMIFSMCLVLLSGNIVLFAQVKVKRGRTIIDRNLIALTNLIIEARKTETKALKTQRQVNSLAARIKSLMASCKDFTSPRAAIYSSIKRELRRLGFTSGKITFEKNKLFKVSIIGYKQTNKHIFKNLL